MKSRIPLRDLGILVAGGLFSRPGWSSPWSTSIFSPMSTPASEVNKLAYFVLGITAAIFLGVSALLIYALVRYRARGPQRTEPPQVFGSVQIELAWTIIPILTLVVLFLGTARVLFSVQDARKPATALDVTVIGHQFWWEFRYPQYNVVTANELHMPLSVDGTTRPTFMKLTSADVMHSFWVPRLAGKTDVIPNRVNEMWIDPHATGLYLGQCAQFCGTQHAQMLLRVYVDTPEQFQQWITAQQKAQPELPSGVQASLPNAGSAGRPERAAPNTASAHIVPVAQQQDVAQDSDAHVGQRVFEQAACINCHTVAGTVANGRYGPDLTHLMSRATLGSGIIPNTPENLKAWIADPSTFKPGCLMPAMHLTDQQNAQITAYLLTLK